MKAVVGLLLVFLGLLIGYLVLTGRLPSSATSTPTSGGGSTSSSGSGIKAGTGSVTGI